MFNISRTSAVRNIDPESNDEAETPEPATTARRPPLRITKAVREQWSRQCVGNARLRFSDVKVAWILLTYLNDATGEAFPGVPTMARLTGTSGKPSSGRSAASKRSATSRKST